MQELTSYQKINIAAQYIALDRAIITEYLPVRKGTHLLSSLKLMLMIYNYPRSTISAIKKYNNSKAINIESTMQYLIDLQYVKHKHKSTWVSQIDAWRVNKTYILTNKGFLVLVKLFENIEVSKDIERKLSEIDHALII